MVVYVHTDRNLRMILTVPRTNGRVKKEDVQPKVEMVIRDSSVISKTGKDVKLNLAGRDFSCCIHSDLPGEFLPP